MAIALLYIWRGARNSHRTIERENKMSHQKNTSELSMEELDNVAGGGATGSAVIPAVPPVSGPAPSAGEIHVTKSLSNIKSN